VRRVNGGTGDRQQDATTMAGHARRDRAPTRGGNCSPMAPHDVEVRPCGSLDRQLPVSYPACGPRQRLRPTPTAERLDNHPRHPPTGLFGRDPKASSPVQPLDRLSNRSDNGFRHRGYAPISTGIFSAMGLKDEPDRREPAQRTGRAA